MTGSVASGHDRAVHDAEQWFLRQGLPYFVASERQVVRRGLSRARLLPVLAGALLAGEAVGVALGLWQRDVSGGLAAGLLVAETYRQ